MYDSVSEHSEVVKPLIAEIARHVARIKELEAELARLQAIEAAAKLVRGVYEPFSSEDHYSAVAKLIAALDAKP